jgi:hypothetical protein
MTTGPDLIIQDFFLNSIYWFAGNIVGNEATAINQGDAAVTTTTIGMYLSVDPTITTGARCWLL